MRTCTFVGHSCNARAFAKHGMTRASPASGGSTTSYLQPDVNRERSDRVQLTARRWRRMRTRRRASYASPALDTLWRKLVSPSGV